MPLLLLLLQFEVLSANKFGIGVYTDTPPATPYQRQLTDASTLVGDGGFVTLWVVLYY